MNTNKTLYISDLDGTLLNQSTKLSKYTTDSLNAMISNGLKFSVATARLLTPARKMLANVKVNVPIVLMNGVLIYDLEHERYVKINKLSNEGATAVIQAMRDFKVTGFMCELDSGELKTYHETFDENPPNDYIKDRIARYYKDYQHTEGFPSELTEKTIYFTLIDVQERLRPIYDILAKSPMLNETLYKNIYSEDLWYLEIFSNEASKQTAVAYLRKRYGFEQVIGFGDNHNDLPMFEACDMRVAVENATSEVKEVADFICGSNENDGVAKWLEANVTIH